MVITITLAVAVAIAIALASHADDNDVNKRWCLRTCVRVFYYQALREHVLIYSIHTYMHICIYTDTISISLGTAIRRKTLKMSIII